jgi:hypothetical protein
VDRLVADYPFVTDLGGLVTVLRRSLES